MALSATLSLGYPANVIAGQGTTASLVISNSGGANVNLIGAQPFMTNGDGKPAGAVRFGSMANALTIASNTGAAIVVPASGSITLNFDFVIDGPLFENTIGQGGSAYLLNVSCMTSDGSVFGPPALGVNVNQISLAPNGTLGQQTTIGSGGTVPAYANTLEAGHIDFSRSLNSYFLVFPFAPFV